MSRRPWLAAALCAILAAAVAGCTAGNDDRPANLQAIARWQDARLAPADSLAAMLTSPDAHVRLAAVRAAGLIGRDDILPRLAETLADPSLTVQREACFALGVLGDTLAVPDLELAAGAGKLSLRIAALRGLAHVPNRGTALLAAATADEPEEAAAAWDGLRNQADQVPRAELLAAIEAGLATPHADVLWRVLRCAERAPDPALLEPITPHLRSHHVQARVHAWRALGRLPGHASLQAALAAWKHGPGRGVDGDRVAVNAARTIGALADAAPDQDLPAAAAILAELSTSPSPHVAQAALEAMAVMAGHHQLPAEAAEQESLLPVWRIRMARAALARLDHPDAGPRAAAAAAWAALRGPGGEAELLARLGGENVAHVRAALAGAAVRLADDPLVMHATVVGGGTLEQAAAIEALADRGADVPPETLAGLLAEAALGADPIVAATAAARLGEAPSVTAAEAVLALAAAPAGPWHGDLVLAALGSLTALGGPDAGWMMPEDLRADAAEALGRAFDDGDVRIRLAARETALGGGFLPEELVPGEASLRATLPAVVRHPEQPPVAVAFAAPRIVGTTARGEFEITLDARTAPNTCAMMISLVKRGFFEGLVFHRVVPDFVVQGGDPTGTGWGGPGWSIRSEWSPLPYERGAVGIAHSGKDTGGCQWFVTLSEQPHLVGRYTVFGKVTRGMEVFDAMQPGDAFSLAIAE
jgi:peptidyl-prolyl cis-trans isomerase B (cyclophilin B)